MWTRSLGIALIGLLACGDEPTTPSPPGSRSPLPARVEIRPPTDSVLWTGDRLRLGFDVWDSAGQLIPNPNVRWTSSDTTIATVDLIGMVRAVSSGRVEIRIEVLVREPRLADTLVLLVHREGDVVWTFSAPPNDRFATMGGAALSHDGRTVYFTTYLSGARNGRIHAVDARSGAGIWQLPLQDPMGGVYPTVGPDGTIYVTGERVHAVAPSGTLRWSRDIEADTYGDFLAQALSFTGDTLYVSGNRRVWALEAATGVVLWTWPAGAEYVANLFVPPTVSADGRALYVPNSAGPFQSLDTRTGAVVWQVPDPEPIPYEHAHFSHGPVPWDGMVLLPARLQLHAYRATDGQHLWSSFSGNGFTEPVVDPELGLLYMQTTSHGLVALRSDGALAWSTTRDVQQAPIWAGGALLAEDGTGYVAAHAGLFALNTRAGGTVRWRYPAPPSVILPFYGAPLLTPEGLLISFTEDALYAFRTRAARLHPTSPWPMWRRNPQRTGTAQG